MSTILESLTQALNHHQSGRRDQAAALYREVLENDPGNADALHLSGMLSFEGGDLARAAELIECAIAANPAAPMFHNNLGNVRLAAGEPGQAAACYERALALDPGYAEAHSNFGNALQALGRAGEALAHYFRSLELQPARAETHNNLANALRLLGRVEEAIGHYRRAAGLRPDYAEALLNLAGALRELDRLEEAEAAARAAVRLNDKLAEAHANLAAILLKRGRLGAAEAAAREAARLKPGLAEAQSNLAAVLIEQKRHEEAAGPCQEALRLKPRLPEANANLGDLYAWQGRMYEALEFYDRALELRPAFAEAHNKRGYALEQLGRTAESLAAYGEAIRLKPDFPDARTNRAMALLRAGDYARGWDEYEWRWKRRESPPRSFEQPLWDGGPLEGRAILLHAEQGLGDAIQFLRYLPLVEARGGRVLLECRARLRPLVRKWLAGDGSRFDVQAPLLSLPRIFGTRLETIPARVPYLDVEPAAAERWRERLGSEQRLRVGLAWAGNPDHPHDRQRSIPVEELALLAACANRVAFYSLQRGFTGPAPLPLIPLEEPESDMAETAAAILALDLVIAADTMVAHLAGALGRPVWTLLPFAADWRWLAGRDDSPWYPTVRLFRQPNPGDWPSVLARVVKELNSLSPVPAVPRLGPRRPGWPKDP